MRQLQELETSKAAKVATLNSEKADFEKVLESIEKEKLQLENQKRQKIIDNEDLQTRYDQKSSMCEVLMKELETSKCTVESLNTESIANAKAFQVVKSLTIQSFITNLSMHTNLVY